MKETFLEKIGFKIYGITMFLKCLMREIFRYIFKK
jgi:hypothetical protein